MNHDQEFFSRQSKLKLNFQYRLVEHNHKTDLNRNIQNDQDFAHPFEKKYQLHFFLHLNLTLKLFKE